MHILFFWDGAFAAVDISPPGQDLSDCSTAYSASNEVGPGWRLSLRWLVVTKRVEVVSRSGGGMSYPQQHLPIERQDCSCAGTPSVQQPTLTRPRLEVAAELRTLGWGVRGVVEDRGLDGWVRLPCGQAVARQCKEMHACGIMTDVQPR